jgi:hypothetical protein
LHCGPPFESNPIQPISFARLLVDLSRPSGVQTEWCSKWIAAESDAGFGLTQDTKERKNALFCSVFG